VSGDALLQLKREMRTWNFYPWCTSYQSPVIRDVRQCCRNRVGGGGIAIVCGTVATWVGCCRGTLYLVYHMRILVSSFVLYVTSDTVYFAVIGKKDFFKNDPIALVTP
jgi:hypothetical protein